MIILSAFNCWHKHTQGRTSFFFTLQAVLLNHNTWNSCAQTLAATFYIILKPDQQKGMVAHLNRIQWDQLIRVFLKRMNATQNLFRRPDTSGITTTTTMPSILTYGGPFQCIAGKKDWKLVCYFVFFWGVPWVYAACAWPHRLALLTENTVGIQTVNLWLRSQIHNPLSYPDEE